MIEAVASDKDHAYSTRALHEASTTMLVLHPGFRTVPNVTLKKSATVVRSVLDLSGL